MGHSDNIATCMVEVYLCLKCYEHYKNYVQEDIHLLFTNGYVQRILYCKL